MTEELTAARTEAADMKGIMADTARILDQKNAEARILSCCSLRCQYLTFLTFGEGNRDSTGVKQQPEAARHG